MAPPFLFKRRYYLSWKAVVPAQHVTEDFDTSSIAIRGGFENG
jgi:hypothetical protein